MSFIKKNNFFWLLFSISFLFMSLLLVLNNINKSCVIPCNGQTIFISDSKYESNGYFAYALDIKKNEFSKFNANKITIFFPFNKCYLTIMFPKWITNDQLLITNNISSNTYLNQTVLIMLGQESLLTFIWNNITT